MDLTTNYYLNLASEISFDSIVDGEGLRVVLWLQGCGHNCQGCHNPSTHTFDQNIIKSVDEVATIISSNPMMDGLTISGGDPFFQVEACKELLKIVDMNVWVYTGYTFEEIMENHHLKQLLPYIDVLVDGPFIESLNDRKLTFKGSSNQRIIDVKESLRANKIILYM